MWLYRIAQVTVVTVVVILTVWTNITQAKSNNSDPLVKHFNFYGNCSNETRPWNMNLNYIWGDYTNFFFGLSGSSRTTISLLSTTSLPCKLPPNVLFCAVPTIKEERLTIKFNKVQLENNETGNGCYRESGNITDNQVDGNEVNNTKRNGRKSDVACNFHVRDVLELQSGYGFISCRADPDAINTLWTDWLESVSAAEDEVSHGRTKTVISVISGTAGIVVVIIICVMCRLRSAPSTYHYGRRPSNTSGGRTGSTHDHHHSRS